MILCAFEQSEIIKSMMTFFQKITTSQSPRRLLLTKTWLKWMLLVPFFFRHFLFAFLMLKSFVTLDNDTNNRCESLDKTLKQFGCHSEFSDCIDGIMQFILFFAFFIKDRMCFVRECFCSRADLVI